MRDGRFDGRVISFSSLIFNWYNVKHMIKFCIIVYLATRKSYTIRFMIFDHGRGKFFGAHIPKIQTKSSKIALTLNETFFFGAY